MEPLFTYRCTLALVLSDLLPSFLGSEGFKVLDVVDGLVISQWFCLGSCFQWHHLIQTYTQAEGLYWGFYRPLMCVSPGAFFFRHSRLPSSCHGNHIWRFEICASFSSRRFGVSQGRVPLVFHSSMSACIGALAIDFAVSFCLWRLYQLGFSPSVVFTP